MRAVLSARCNCANPQDEARGFPKGTTTGEISLTMESKAGLSGVPGSSGGDGDTEEE
jgi:hypothetical protein